jgi:phenylalanyl-tRNA synthetase beta chain
MAPIIAEQWGEKNRNVDFFDLRADLDALLHPVRAEYRPAAHPSLHPGQCAQVWIEGAAIGWIGALHPRLTQKYAFAKAPVLFEIDMAPLMNRTAPRYQGLPRFPAVRRDIAVVVDADLSLGDILARLKSDAPALLADIDCFDVYQGQGVQDGRKSLAFKMLLQHTEKTLTDSEIDCAVVEV